MTKIYLLTHEREVDKKTNTGRLVLACANIESTRIVWRRTEPNETLLALIESDMIAMLYPSVDGDDSCKLEDFDHFLVLDSTWQESKKMINKSPYLKSIPTVAIASEVPSTFRRRRNQVDGGLCTAEVVIQLLKQKGDRAEAESLECQYQQFNQS